MNEPDVIHCPCCGSTEVAKYPNGNYGEVFVCSSCSCDSLGGIGPHFEQPLRHLRGTAVTFRTRTHQEVSKQKLVLTWGEAYAVALLLLVGLVFIWSVVLAASSTAGRAAIALIVGAVAVLSVVAAGVRRWVKL